MPSFDMPSLEGIEPRQGGRNSRNKFVLVIFFISICNNLFHKLLIICLKHNLEVINFYRSLSVEINTLFTFSCFYKLLKQFGVNTLFKNIV